MIRGVDWVKRRRSTLAMLLVTLAVLLVLWLLVRAVGVTRGRAFSLEGKVVVVTGAASGIGRRLTQKVFKETTDVVLALLDIDTEALKALQTELLHSQDAEEGSKRVIIYECNVADHRSVEATIARVVDNVAPKHIGVLINNAGIVMGKSLEDLTPEQIQKTFAVNTLAHFWTVRNALPSMKKASEAMLVTLSSVMGMTSSAGLTDYCASKAAVNAFHESLRLELWRDEVTSIRTLLVCPAAVDTGMFAGVLSADDWALKISRFCIPMLSESEVVDAIYRSIRRGDELLVSCFSGWRGVALSWAPVISRMLPVPVYDVVVRLGGGLNGMDTFVGRHNSSDKDKVKVN
ncbi:hypothetical protein F442_00399 [Phytophthora nicotianae P10297]|uniref:Ketoreductase domain-containing protein n=4 Tax=Phytophthora nicotianae TaxID=4792 RepID=V9G1Q1_PHYNI|nr:hypothetical protein F443_00417 [Phytophthora nicotianae P1569]ETM56689.1 hypothetical protein L914_00378 [Phytophthora nicotianae]ETO86006.1 hypothetical protein F444_00405 [Phytophthora nicotianae P1976]ETP54999.1 hypothetical protein F442_00399 [Phytophthora nicotianae P10297]